MASLREGHIKLWILEDEEANPKFFGKLKIGDGKSYASLREWLEANNVLDWAFDFWDVENGCRIQKSIESLNDIMENVYAIPSGCSWDLGLSFMASSSERHIKLWIREDEDVESKLFGKLKVGDGKSYASLRKQLEANNVLDWAFDFWDVEDGLRIQKRIESLNDIVENVHVIPSSCFNPQPTKRQRVEPTNLQLVVEPEVAMETCATPLGSFRTSGDSDSNEDCEECNQDGDNPMINYLEGDAMPRCSNEGSSNAPTLDPKHKIFLSHNGAQKEFVEHLFKALEERWYLPFFDRCSESLPMGERFPKLIIQAAEQCEMLIVVVSNEYFMSKWPMIELNAFVKAHQLNRKGKSPKNGPKIFPLFYELSVKDLEDEAMQKKWFENWEKLAEDDPKKRIVVSDWKDALDVLRSFNGLEYNKQKKEIVAYIKKIVTHVSKLIDPNLKWHDSHVQGKSRICEVIRGKIGSISVSKKWEIKVVGIHGVGGIGKTTTCKTLSNELLREYEGRVCYVEFPTIPSKDSVELLRKVLVDLTRKSKQAFQDLDEGKCKSALDMSLSKQKVFLAMDNVSDDYESMKLAKMFLEAPYHKESLVIVTARSKSILERLGIDGDACVEMPELEVVDAMKLFLHHAARGKKFPKDEDKGHILKCIQRCYFSKGDGVGSHYHPLALEALGLQMSYHGENPLEWVKNLPMVRTFSSSSRANPVFDILRSNFDLLEPSLQSLFMDVGLFFNLVEGRVESMQWLCNVHKEDKDGISRLLEILKRKGLVQDVDLRVKESNIHDLYIEFAELEAKGAFNESRDLRMRKWVYVDNGDLSELERTPEGSCWPDLVHLAIVQPYSIKENQYQVVGQISRLKRIQWDRFPHVELLHLEGLHWGQGTFNLERLTSLRVLYLFGTEELASLEGLGNLMNLTHFDWQYYHAEGLRSHIVGSLPLSLKSLSIEQNVVFRSDLLVQCHFLSELDLVDVEASSLDLSNCESLERVILQGVSKLQSLSFLPPCRPSRLQALYVHWCNDLVGISGLNRLIGLKKLQIHCCNKLEVPGWLALTNLLDLELRLGGGESESLVLGAQDSIPRQLQELNLRQYTMGLNLNGFNQLEVLNLGWSYNLVSLGVWDLPALQCLNLDRCIDLLRLPNLSTSSKLEHLDLTECRALELHEKDIQMLSKLTLLQPVRFVYPGGIWLDFHRRKALMHSCKEYWHKVGQNGLHWKEHEWKERDLNTLPITVKSVALYDKQEFTSAQI